jgi:hypothetical protein
MDALIAERFTLLDSVQGRANDRFRVYRRNDGAAPR